MNIMRNIRKEVYAIDVDIKKFNNERVQEFKISQFHEEFS
jgi:hypothetical protein